MTTAHAGEARRIRAAPMSPERRREAIIDATIPLVREHGFAVSTRQIAEAAGIAEGTIFRVFDDKETLLRHAVRAALDPADAEAKLRDIDLAVPLPERVRVAAGVLGERMADVLELATAIGPANLPAGEHDEHEAQYVRLTNLLTALFEPDRDQLRCEPAEAARLLRLVAFGGSHPRLTGGRPLTAAEIADLLLNGVRRHPGEHPSPETPTERPPC